MVNACSIWQKYFTERRMTPNASDLVFVGNKVCQVPYLQAHLGTDLKLDSLNFVTVLL